jgi:hypothetical protein
MNYPREHRLGSALRFVRPATLVVTLVAVLAACAVGVSGPYDGDGYVAGYYEPPGVVYGGWGGGYRVGPARGGDRGGDRGRSQATHAYHAAAPSRATPSIPSHGSRRR